MPVKKIPNKLQSVLWSCNINQLDLKRDRAYIIHQILIYGTMKDLKWLFKIYSKKDVINAFIDTPYKNYPQFIYHWVKNCLLGLRKTDLDINNYVTSIHGTVRPRAADSF